MFLVIVLLAGSIPAMSVAAQSPASENSSINLVVRTPHFQITETGVSVPGYAVDSTPGHPGLPIYGKFVELPPTGAWEVAFEPVGSQVLPQRVSVSAAPVPELDLGGPVSWTELSPEQLPSVVPLVDRPDPAVYGVDAFYPATPVTAGEPIWQGQQRLLPVRVYPFQYNPVTRELRYHPEFRIQIRVAPAPAGETPAAAALKAASAAAMPAAANGLRIRTGSAGMHRLTYADLTAAGVPDGTDTATFAMTYLGQPIDIRVLDDDGKLSSGDSVVFYAEAYSGRYMTQNVYFFAYGSAASSDRMTARSVSPPAAPVITSVMQRTVHFEWNRVYYSTYDLPRDADHIFDNALYANASVPVAATTYTLALHNLAETGTARLRAAFHGGQALAQAPDQSVALRINGYDLGVHTWDGSVTHIVDVSVPLAALVEGDNALRLEAELVQLPGLSSYWVSPDWVELDYPALANAQGDVLSIEGLYLAPTDTSVQVETTGFTTDQVTVYDVRTPRQPIIVLAPQTTHVGTGYDLDFFDTWPAGSPAPKYFLASDAALLAPLAVEVADAPAWNTPANNYDYIAIVHRSLWDAVQPLLDWRGSQGLRVAKVDVQHIYDLYSGGRLDPEAIRAFLIDAYFNWYSGGPRPHYVLLVGDGHYDFKSALNTPVLNLIPPYLLHIDPWIGETAADNRYVSVNGADDYVPDMALGRISAQNPTELTAAVNKILAYEDPTHPGYVPDGAWQNTVTFVADQADDQAGNFQAFSESVRLNSLPTSYDSRHLYWETDYAVAYPNMNDAIKAALGDSVMLQWFGHASKFRWGSTQVFSNSSIRDMAVTPQWPFTVDYSCWTGYFINLYNFFGDYRSLNEAFLLSTNKGSVATLGPSGQHVGSALLTLNQGLVKAVFDDQIMSLGDEIDEARQYFLANSNGWHDVIDTTVFFGDPAMRLRLPTDPNAAPNPPYVGISSLVSGAINLDWGHPDITLTQYQVWRSEAPYFSPVPAQGTQLGSFSFSQFIYGESRPFSYVDNGSCGYFVADGQQLTCQPQSPTVTVTGDPLHNYFWIVRGGNSGGEFADSNRVGEFDYPLVKGN